MGLSVLLVQNESISDDMRSLLVRKKKKIKTDCISHADFQQGAYHWGKCELVLTQDQLLKQHLKHQNIDVIVWRELSDLSAKVDVFLQLRRYRAKFPLKLKNWALTEVLHDSEDAIIYLARDMAGKQAAIKRFKFKPSCLSAEAVQRFLTHLEKQCAVKSKGLVRFYEGGVCDQTFYLVMEYMKYGTLRQSLNSCGDVLPKIHALQWFHEVVLALDTVHKVGLIHRDLKIDNIMLRGDGSLALMDYGVSKRILLDAGFMGESELHCSPHYVSPEQISGDACTQQSDIYSLGVIFYELLTGHKPYASNEAHELMMHHIMAPVPVLPYELQQFQAILDKMMAKDPDDRFANVIDVIEGLPVAA